MKKSTKQIWIAVLCLYFFAIIYLCFLKPDSLPEVRPDLWGIPFDKVVHFAMFFPYPILSYLAFRPAGRSRTVRSVVLLILFATGAGLAMGTEQLQGVTGYRSCDINDFYADVVGMGTSSLILLIFIILSKDKIQNV